MKNVFLLNIIPEFKYDVSTFIDYSFRTFDVIFIVWPLLNVWPLSTYDV